MIQIFEPYESIKISIKLNETTEGIIESTIIWTCEQLRYFDTLYTELLADSVDNRFFYVFSIEKKDESKYKDVSIPVKSACIAHVIKKLTNPLPPTT